MTETWYLTAVYADESIPIVPFLRIVKSRFMSFCFLKVGPVTSKARMCATVHVAMLQITLFRTVGGFPDPNAFAFEKPRSFSFVIPLDSSP